MNVLAEYLSILIRTNYLSARSSWRTKTEVYDFSAASKGTVIRNTLFYAKAFCRKPSCARITIWATWQTKVNWSKGESSTSMNTWMIAASKDQENGENVYVNTAENGNQPAPLSGRLWMPFNSSRTIKQLVMMVSELNSHDGHRKVVDQYCARRCYAESRS